jgi:hypothetical protein
MGRTKHTTECGVSTRGRRLGWRTCLRKGCGRRYRARHWRQRYCQVPSCQQKLRRWQAAKRQRKRRATAKGREKHAQAERERRRRKKRKGTSANSSVRNRSRGHAMKKIPPGPMCDRPGCFEPPRASAAPAHYCGDECCQAMRRVRDRERKWKCRKGKAGCLKRRRQHQAAQATRRQLCFAHTNNQKNSYQTPLGDESHPVRVSGHTAMRTLNSSHSQTKQTLGSSPCQEVPADDQERDPPSRPRPPPAS